MRRVLLSLSLVASVCAVPGAAANTSHAGWPQIDGDLIMHKLDQSGPITQDDVLQGGAGRDFIYASHGRNTIDTGGGNDVVHAHFGYGSITCHSPGTIVFLSRRSRPGYQLRGCRHISYQTLGS
jgi:hypothetical protein